MSGGIAPAGETAAAAASDSRRLGHLRWSLLFGNFVIGCGVMAPVGTLADIARSLDVSVGVAGQLVAVAAVMMCFGAPLLASWVGGIDRRKLLVASLAWYAVGHALCALMPTFSALLPVRAATVLGAAVFTPQAAAAIGAMTQPAERAGAITFIFIGWSVASVVGMPTSAWLGDTFGWQSAFLAIAAICALGAVWVLVTMPTGVRPPSLTLASWQAAFGSPVLMAIVLVTALNRGHPGMAAVDVFEAEPILQGHLLLRLENAVCTPHIGYVELDSYELYFRAAFENVVNFVEGRPTNIVNPEALKVRH